MSPPFSALRWRAGAGWSWLCLQHGQGISILMARARLPYGWPGKRLHPDGQGNLSILMAAQDGWCLGNCLLGPPICPPPLLLRNTSLGQQGCALCQGETPQRWRLGGHGRDGHCCKAWADGEHPSPLQANPRTSSSSHLCMSRNPAALGTLLLQPEKGTEMLQQLLLALAISHFRAVTRGILLIKLRSVISSWGITWGLMVPGRLPLASDVRIQQTVLKILDTYWEKLSYTLCCRNCLAARTWRSFFNARASTAHPAHTNEPQPSPDLSTLPTRVALCRSPFAFFKRSIFLSISFF